MSVDVHFNHKLGQFMPGRSLFECAESLEMEVEKGRLEAVARPVGRERNFAEQFQQGAACFERFTEVMDIEPDIVRGHCRQDGQFKVEVNENES